MLLILRIVADTLSKAGEAFYQDERVSHLPLLGSPLPMAILIALYLLFVMVWGPNWLMRDRKPYKVDTLMQCYNVFQVILNLYVFWSSLRYSYLQPHFNFNCQKVDPNDMNPAHLKLRYAAYVYYISKYLDLLDTVFFVLRKKFNQITFLHVYHHGMMIFGVWAYLTLLFASHFTLTGVINSFIHVVMYSYYFVAALKLDIDLEPWKRRLTQMQILQFCLLTIHFFKPIVSNWCGLTMFWVWVAFLQNFFIMALFCDFYYRTYIAKGKRKELTPSSGKVEENVGLRSEKDAKL